MFLHVLKKKIYTKKRKQKAFLRVNIKRKLVMKKLSRSVQVNVDTIMLTVMQILY